MKINNARKWVPFSAPHRLMMTLLITGAVFTIRYILHPFLTNHAAFLPFIITAQVIAFFYGYQFAFFTQIIGALLASYFFTPPYQTFSMPNGEDLIILSSYFIASAISIVLIEYLRRARYSNRLLLMMSQSRYNCLLRLDNHRIHLQRRATRSRQDLSNLLEYFDQVILLQLPSGEICLQSKFYEITDANPITDSQSWVDFIDVTDKQRLVDLLSPEQMGRFIQIDVPLHFTDTNGTKKLIDCVFQSIPLDSGKTAMVLRLGKGGKVRQEPAGKKGMPKVAAEPAI